MKQEAWFVRGFETAGHKRSAETELVSALLFISERSLEQPHRNRRHSFVKVAQCTSNPQSESSGGIVFMSMSEILIKRPPFSIASSRSICGPLP